MSMSSNIIPFHYGMLFFWHITLAGLIEVHLDLCSITDQSFFFKKNHLNSQVLSKIHTIVDLNLKKVCVDTIKLR